MKILHVSTSMNRRGGDVQMLTTIDLFKDSLGINHIVLCAKNSPLGTLCTEKNVSFRVANRKSFLFNDYVKKIISIVKNEQIDVVHVHDSKAHALALVANMLIDLKIVFSKKRDNPIRPSYWRKLKYNHPSVANIICLSSSIKNTFNGILKTPEKAVVIYDGIDVDLYASQKNSGILHRDYQLPDDAFIIGNAAALVGQKDLVTFLNAASIILKKSTRNIMFIILGEGELLAQLKAHSLELGIAEKIIFAGFRRDFAQVLPEFDMLMMSSTSEGLPLTLLSALAARIPVVSTSAGGIGEVIQHRETGMLSPTKNPAMLAENALALMEDSVLHQHIVERAYALIHEKFSLQDMRENYSAFYRSL
jgi:glycosyltransferase involved in cell wall biosynthesis